MAMKAERLAEIPVLIRRRDIFMSEEVLSREADSVLLEAKNYGL